MNEKTVLVTRTETMNDAKEFIDFFRKFKNKKIIILDVGFTQLSRTPSKTVFIKISVCDGERAEMTLNKKRSNDSWSLSGDYLRYRRDGGSLAPLAWNNRVKEIK